jgi:hypothetical protein
MPNQSPAGVRTLRALIQQERVKLFMPGYLEMSTGQYVCYPVDSAAILNLWTQWRSLLPQHGPPKEPTIHSPEDADKALDSLLRRLDKLFGPASETLEALSALSVPGPVFTQADLDRALDALDLCFQDQTWPEGEARFRRGLLIEDVRERNITRALAEALVDKLVSEGIFRMDGTAHIRTSIPLAGTDQTTEIDPYIFTTRERWYTCLSQRKPPAPGAKDASTTAGHNGIYPNSDFTMVKWGDIDFSFSLGVQSSAVRVLFEEWRKSGMGLHQQTIRDAIDTERDNFRMDLAFRKHPAFGKMIQSCGDGRYQLVRPGTASTPRAKKAVKGAKITPKPRRKRG